MGGNSPLVHHISDTALWTAIHRARESERPDAQFRDPFARRLAGERGEQIAAGLAISEADSWSWMARTYLYDHITTQQVQRGVDMVVNLGAGLDTRPYRMTWPESLTWVEVDLPDTLKYKEEILAPEKPHCALERISMDLADVPARRCLFASLGKKSTKALMLTEGVMIYLTPEEAGALARDLAAVPTFHFWMLDIASPGLLHMLRERVQPQFSQSAPQLRFAPDNGPEFFAAHGWKAVEVQSLLKTAARLHRLPEALQQAAQFPEDPVRMGHLPWSGVCLFERS